MPVACFETKSGCYKGSGGDPPLHLLAAVPILLRATSQLPSSAVSESCLLLQNSAAPSRSSACSLTPHADFSIDSNLSLS